MRTLGSRRSIGKEATSAEDIYVRRFCLLFSVPTFCVALALAVTPFTVAFAGAPGEAGDPAPAAHARGLAEHALNGARKSEALPGLPVDLPAPAQEVVDHARDVVGGALADVPGIGGVDIPAVPGVPGQQAPGGQAAPPSQLSQSPSPARGSLPSARDSSSTRRDRTVAVAAADSSRGSSSRGLGTADQGQPASLASPVADLVKSAPAAATTTDSYEPSPITRLIELVPRRYWIAIGALAALCLLLAAVLIRERVRSRRAEHQAQTDPLTGLMNRRAFDAALAKEWVRAQRYDRPLGLLFLDVDRFKQFNDSKGHLAGDDLLRELANMLLAELRSIDVAARLGGDEFVVVCPETDHNGVEQVARRLSQVLADLPAKVSVGWAARRQADGTLSELMSRADRQMYRAKAVTGTG